jgi:hypothetical protein
LSFNAQADWNLSLCAVRLYLSADERDFSVRWRVELQNRLRNTSYNRNATTVSAIQKQCHNKLALVRVCNVRHVLNLWSRFISCAFLLSNFFAR